MIIIKKLGLGIDFLNRIEEFARSQKITHIFLQTEKIVPAYHFYQKMVFLI